ncbi:unnamed protein product [Adineta ricciae]|uniref:Uncharacterized protein n=1 Tax=Adineta ricciae TaxID=249248 RepID=A0A816DDB9_ADIRI|nr:unnamed protein product [Adineta ricciae]
MMPTSKLDILVQLIKTFVGVVSDILSEYSTLENISLDDVETNVSDYGLQSVEQLERENEIGKTIFTERSRVVNLESITAVLLDPDLEAVRQLEKKVKDIIDYVELFDNPAKCEEYMRQIKYEGIIFIVSSLIVTSIISNIHDLQQLHAIYVYNQSKTKIKEDWIEKNCTKVRKYFPPNPSFSYLLNVDKNKLNSSEMTPIKQSFERSLCFPVTKIKAQ